jgi:hypothetical protein
LCLLQSACIYVGRYGPVGRWLKYSAYALHKEKAGTVAGVRLNLQALSRWAK